MAAINGFLLCFSVWSYRYRDEKIRADINKLYDTRPTKSSADAGDGDRHRSADPHHVDEAPFFDLNNSGDVTAVLGKTAILNCRVKNVGNKTVIKNNVFFVIKVINECPTHVPVLAAYDQLFCSSNLFPGQYRAHTSTVCQYPCHNGNSAAALCLAVSHCNNVTQIDRLLRE